MENDFFHFCGGGGMRDAASGWFDILHGLAEGPFFLNSFKDDDHLCLRFVHKWVKTWFVFELQIILSDDGFEEIGSFFFMSSMESIKWIRHGYKSKTKRIKNEHTKPNPKPYM